MTGGPLFSLLTGSQDAQRIVAFGPPGSVTLAEFRARAAALALTVTGLRTAALACRDSAAFAIGLFGLLSAGVEVVLPPNMQPDTLENLTHDVDRIIDDTLVWLAGLSSTPAAAPRQDQARIAFFTSGSTGQPKRIIRTLDMLEREVLGLERTWGAELGACQVNAMVSHQHLYGLTFKILWPLAAGRAFDRGCHDVWEGLIAALTSPSMLISSPAHLGRLAGIPPLPADRQPRMIFSAGAPLSLAAALDGADILGCAPTEIFGSTETGAVATRRQTPGQDGWTLLAGHRLLPHPQGLLRLYSPYDNRESETADLIEATAEGFRFLGRSDRIAKIAGKRVSLAEVERLLSASPWVETSAAVALPGDHEQLGAVIVPTALGWQELERLGSFRFGRVLRRELANALEPAAIPKLWRFVTELPSHPMGKIKTADLRALFTTKAMPCPIPM